MLNEGRDGVFPIPDADYVSVPTEITFYEQIEGAMSIDAAIEARYGFGLPSQGSGMGGSFAG